MTTRKRLETNVGKRPISITAVVDAVGALATGTLHGNLYFYEIGRAHV